MICEAFLCFNLIIFNKKNLSHLLIKLKLN